MATDQSIFGNESRGLSFKQTARTFCEGTFVFISFTGRLKRTNGRRAG